MQKEWAVEISPREVAKLCIFIVRKNLKLIKKAAFLSDRCCFRYVNLFISTA